MIARPVALPVLAEGIPDVIKRDRRWVTWAYEMRESTWTKVPFNPHTGALASASDPATWATYAAAMAAYRFGGRSGVGFMLDGSGLTFIDMDHVRDPVTGVVAMAWASDVLDNVPSYTEISPSGTGLHILALGMKPGPACKHNHNGACIEMYDTGRYMTITGHGVAGTAPTIEPCANAIAYVYQRYVEHTLTTNGRAHSVITRWSPAMSDDEVLTRALRAKNGAKVSALLDGDTSAYGGDDSSADLALVSILAFYTQDGTQLDELMRRSRLMRDKWDSRRGSSTYGADTISRALNGLTETWRARS
jgi:putative DNA primase/helicase